MRYTPISIRHLSFTGPDKEPAVLTFRLGLNVLYGASETGKSFVLETIDFMLGGNTPLRDIPERVGYDRIHLGIEVNADKFTFIRASGGGNIQLFEGLHQSFPHGHEFSVLSTKHDSANELNISNFLLTKIGLSGKYVKRNASGATRNLSFRDLSHLCLIDEGRIQKIGSPIEPTGQVIFKTAEYSVFKLLLTGIDDSAYVSAEIPVTTEQNNASKIELIDELIAQYRKKLPETLNSDNDLMEQAQRLNVIIQAEQDNLNDLEREFYKLSTSRAVLRKRIEESVTRRDEIKELDARFRLLNDHYLSDLRRLEGIHEAGALVNALQVKSCPLCGASPDHQHPEQYSIGNLDFVIEAAKAEREKILRLQSELLETSKQLEAEAQRFDQTIPEMVNEQDLMERELSKTSEKLSSNKLKYTTVVERRSEIASMMSLLQQITELNERKASLEAFSYPNKPALPPEQEVDLSTSILDQFAMHVSTVLKAWNFPESERVQFDEKTRDIIIAGKRRSSRGKGMRSITHAAFMVSLLEFCRDKPSPHPGFLVIDSPLLAYREPEDSDDDLSNTDVQDRFYEYLSKWTNGQIIIIENITPPLQAITNSASHFFTKNTSMGRYGFFPPVTR